METGQKLPENLGFDQDGKEWKTSKLAGKKVVLYVYPKDSTPGCTSEACSLRDNYERFLAQGYVVLGVSAQDARSHKKFIEKYSLPFPLICDTEHRLMDELGVERRRWPAEPTWEPFVQPSSLTKKEPSFKSSIRRKSR